MTIDRIPDSELEVMQILWDHEPPVSRAWLEEKINETRPLAQTTILTLVSRLMKKGFVKAEKNGRSSVYTPMVSKEEYLAAQSERFVKCECGGNISVFASALTHSGLSSEELDELRKLLFSDKL